VAKYEELSSVADGVGRLSSLFTTQMQDGVSAVTADELVDELIGLQEIADQVEGFLDRVAKLKETVGRLTIDAFVDKGQNSVTRRGKTVYLANEYWPGPSIKDLLPDGVSDTDPDYAATVAKVREAAKDRLLLALKDSANLSYLVQENYNSQSLRSALTGKDADKDDDGKPILPPELDGIVDLNPQTKIRMRKGGKGS